MSDIKSNVVLNFKSNGEVSFAQSLKEINSVMNAAAKEYKANIAAMGDNASTAEKLGAEQKKLQTQLTAADHRVETLTEQFTKMKNSGEATTTQLNNMAGKLANAERVQTNLKNRLTEVNEALSKEGQESLNAKDKLANLSNEASQLDAKEQKLTSAYKLQQAELSESASKSEKLAANQKSLGEILGVAKQKVTNLEEALKATKSAYGENSTEAMQMGTKLNNAKADVNKLENELKNLGKESETSGSKLEQIGKKIDANNWMQLSDMLSGIGDKFKELGGSVIESASDYMDGQAKMQASMGTTASETDKLMGVVKNVMSKGVVESVDEAVEAVGNVKTAFGDLNNTQLTKLTDEITTLSKRTGTDYNDNIKAASMLNKSFGISGQDAIQLITAGFQNGANASGDFLDTVNEYGPQFKDAGFSAQQMMSIIIAGAKDGAFNTDKAADAVKELGLKMTDNSTPVNQYFGQFSKHTQNLVKDLRKGKATSGEVTKSIANDLKNMTPSEQKSALSALGTQFEDLGNKASISLLGAAGSTKKVSSNLDEMNKKTPSEQFKGALNQLKQSFGELVTAMTPILKGLTNIIKAFSSAPEPIKIFVGVFGAVITLVTTIIPLVGALAAAMGALDITLLPLIAVIGAVVVAITAIILVIKNWGTIVKWIQELWSGFKTFIKKLWVDVKKIFTETLTAITAFVKQKWTEIKTKTSEIWNGIKSFISGVWNAIKSGVSNAINSVKTTMSNVWNGIKSTTSNIWNGIKSVISSVWNAIKSGVSNSINATKSIISGVWNAIKSVTSSVWNAIKSIISGVWSGIKSIATSSVNAIKSVISGVWNGIKSITQSIWNAIKAIISGEIYGIKSIVSGVTNGIRSVISGVWNGIRSVTSSVWNGIKNAMVSPINAAKSVISGIVQTIKGLFNFRLRFPSISIPHIPLPHFSLSGSFNPLKGKIPHVGINWYAKGGIFDQPTLFPTNSGFNGLGEAGPEAALPLNAENLAGIGKGIAANMPANNRPIYLQVDGRTFAKLTAPYMSNAMGSNVKLNQFGMGGI
ncbi:MAG: phage tail tape measure protein [Liquorilactobacillus nagelii]|uniref:phage tail tape measure protein n=1 Tax=Liquorilactobacillus nagelii TaxID=82688 RepID=UPI0039ECD52C